MKKLLNKRGSVLFLVVVVMALLLVAASATYYVIRNQHMSANTHYASEQSYQTASSVSNTIGSYFTKVQTQISQTPALYTGSIFEKMMELSEGESLTTGENDFRDEGLGEYDISIQRIANPDPGSDEEGEETAYFQITTTAEVNGETTTLVQVWKIRLSPSETKYFTRFLTSTGYREGDGLIVANYIYGDTYFENPFTRAGIGAYQRSVYSSGTLADDGLHFMEVSHWEDLEIVIADNYYVDTSAGGGEIQIGGLYVGGNLVDGTPDNGGKALLVENLFVLGDLTLNVGGHKGNFYVQGDCYINSNIQSYDTNFYINGDLYLSNVSPENKTIYLDKAHFHVNGDVYFQNQGALNPGTLEYYGEYHNETSGAMTDDTIESIAHKITDVSAGFIIKDKMTESTGGDFDGWDSVARYISTKTARGSYNDWKAENLVPDTTPIKLDNYALDIIEHENIYGQDYFITLSESCTIRPATEWAGWGNYYILIDATEKDIYIKLDPNGKDTFMFGEITSWDGSLGACPNLNILVKGSHAAVFVLPDNTSFKMGSNTFIGHLDVALALTGQTDVRQLFNSGIKVASYLDDENKAKNMYNLMADKTLTGEIDEATGKDKVIFVYDKSKFGGIAGATPHNNIFFISNSESTLNFGAGDAVFCGYIYAPKTILEVNNMSKGLAFLGGLIVGSYSYYGYNATLIFTDPYEEGGRGSAIVTDLMSKANGVDFDASDSTEKSLDFSAELVGYK